MYLVDSCGWLEWFTDGKLAETYRQYLQQPEELLVPSIVLHEVYKVLKREVGEEKALMAAGHMKTAEVVDLDEVLALKAADLAILHHLAMADAIVYATGIYHNCEIVTTDTDLKGLPGVLFIPKP
jgi:predicted nucleic acid-binding protein